MIYKNLNGINLNYSDFCKHVGKNANPWENDPDAKKAFDLLCTPECLTAMIVFSDAGFPAMAGIILKLQKQLAGSKTFIIDKRANSVKKKPSAGSNTASYRVHQLIGRMISYIMNSVGYEHCRTGLEKGTALWKLIEDAQIDNSAVYESKNGSNVIVLL